MLSENKSNTRGSPNDSGHSSIDHYSPKEDKHECFEVLDLRMRNVGEVVSNGEPNANIVLDVPSPSQTKSNKEKRLSQSFSSRTVLPMKVTQKKNMSALGLDVKKDMSRAASVNSSASSVNSNDSKTINSASRLSVAGKLRQKTVSQNAKKGPMKAVIPVGDMKKRYSLAVTPEKSKISSAMQSKRTSTPISGPKLKPMAASTPAGRPVKHQKEIAHSPLGKPDARCSFGRDQPSTPPSSLPKSLNTESKFLRRNSVSEIKKSEGIGKLKRSNSVEKESGIMSSLAKVRQNIINSPYYHSKRNSLRESNSNEAENRTKGIPVAKSVSLVPKLRTLGKENRGK
ncbi:hypothetical protein NQ317_016916 [Molorchus minor]|uniref:Uncharacterized protein n=1 Tax=Molorchus minor TaxID=1323400 RepID=A0ABQ9K3V1_9CUCU|nr:hypothetical protein NQ317_016916 [Molorchus minor]